MVSTILALLLSAQVSQVSINDLISNSHEYHESVIEIEAEVILEVLEREDFAWINVNDGSNAIGVYLPIEMTKDIKIFGDYNHRGDIVRIIGVFSRNCDEHGGEIDIHATSLEIVSRGVAVTHKVPQWKWILGLTSFTLSMILLTFHRRRKGLPVKRNVD